MPSRLGFKGSEELGHGLKAQFVVEMGFAVGTGASMQSGRGFGRQSYVGLQGDWGSVTLGRQYTMSSYALAGTDLMGPSVFGLGSIDSYIPNNRLDNALAYRGRFGALEVGFLYSLGRDGLAPSLCAGEAGSASCNASSALAKWDAKTWGISLANDHLRGSTGSAFFGQPSGLTIGSGSFDDHTYLTGFVLLGKARWGAGVIRRQLKAVSETYRSNQYYVAASYPLAAPFILDGTITYLRANRDQANAALLSLRASYVLSSRTKVYAIAGVVRNDDNVGYSVSGGTSTPVSPGLGKGQTGLMLGLFHAF
jgi:predicted porin